MIITAEISYYPLSGDIHNPIKSFIDELSSVEGISVETGIMSSVVSGEYMKVMSTLTNSMEKLMKEHPSVFNLKISNSCPV